MIWISGRFLVPLYDVVSCISGSASGDIRIWDSNTHQLLSHLTNEHKSTSLFRNFGTVQIGFIDDNIYSCGGDGTIKMRSLQSLNLEQL